MPPKRKKKGDDDDFFASLAISAEPPSEPSVPEETFVVFDPEETATSGKAKTKTRKQAKDERASAQVDGIPKRESRVAGRDDGSGSDDAAGRAASTVNKKAKKKKKGKYDESDEDESAVLPTLASAAGKKKKNNKGKRGNGDESDENPTEEVEIESNKEPKKERKVKRKGKAGKTNESDSDDPLAVMKKLAAMSDSDEDAAADPPAPPGEADVDPDGTDLIEKSIELETAVRSDNDVPIVVSFAETAQGEEHGRPSKAKGRMSKAERKKSKTVGDVSVSTAPSSLVVPATEVVNCVNVSAEAAECSQSDVAELEAVDNAEIISTALVRESEPAAPAVLVAEGKPKKKTKLELKLEAAKKAREEAEAKKRTEGVPGGEVTEAVASMSKLSVGNTARADAGEKVSGVKEGKDGVLVSTMFGDDVFSEHVVHAKEIKYDKAALQASAEGAQFAVSQSVVNINDPQWQNALDIIIPNFSISAHNKELFYNAELNIAHGRRYGLVGPNGAGKSTLLKMISAGELKVPPRVDYLYVEQEVLADGTRAVDAVLKADKERWELIEEEKRISAELEEKADDEKDVRLGEIHARLDTIGAAAAEGRARRILFGLGFDAEMQVRPTQFFSGGWRMRIALARALFIEPTLLMLDEPTNHLDLNAVIWLDDYLQKWKKTVLIVSHDQDFLNSVCDEIIHLDDKKLHFYKGNYDSFKEQETIVKKQRQKEWEKQERKLRELKSKGSSKAGAEKSMIKSKAREPGARATKKAEAANITSGIESAETKIELLKRPKDYTVQFSFPEVAHVTPPILEVHDVTFQYGPRLPVLFKKLNFGLDMSSRVCIVGPNGSGKSTILKLITGEINPEIGDIRRNPRLRVGVYNQHFMDRLPMDEDAVTYIRRMFNDQTYQSARNILGRYGLEGHAHTIPIRDLSGGQKARVVFVELSLMAPHLLFLDEPTNNLDIESIDALCDALQAYNGGVILVSHDARLIETTACQLWVVEDQNVTPWESGFEGYRAHLLRKLEEQLSIIIAGGGERPT